MGRRNQIRMPKLNPTSRSTDGKDSPGKVEELSTAMTVDERMAQITEPPRQRVHLAELQTAAENNQGTSKVIRGKGCGCKCRCRWDRVQGAGQGAGAWCGVRVQGAGCRVQGTGYRVQGEGNTRYFKIFCPRKARKARKTYRDVVLTTELASEISACFVVSSDCLAFLASWRFND